MKKRFLAALVCVVLLTTLLPTVALAAEAIPDIGLDLSTNTPTRITTYTAGSGTVVWNPAVSPATLTFNNATITAGSSDSSVLSIHAVKLPHRPVTVVFNGTNSIAANNDTYACAFRCNNDTVFNLSAGSETTLTIPSGQNTSGIFCDYNASAEIRGTGKLNIDISAVMFSYPIAAHSSSSSSSLSLAGGTLALRSSSGSASSSVSVPTVKLGGVTIPDGETLDLHLVTGSVTKGASGAVNNGTLVLPNGTTSAQIAALGLTGSGTVKVGSDTYTNGGQRMYTSRMDFTQTAALGGWKENATLAADGYTFTGGPGGGYTLTLGNILIQINADPCIVLPADGPVRVILADGTTARITQNGANPAMMFRQNGAIYPCTISGGGKLVLTANNNGRSCIDTQQPLTIAGGDITMNNNSGYTCIDAHNTALTISGGSLSMNAKDTAVSAGSVTLLNGIIPLSPAGAKFLDGNFRLNGNPVARLILGTIADEASVPETGDDTPLLLLCGLLLFSGAGLIAMRAMRKRRHEQ